jgi:alpha-1,6-mannosyltransferase
MRRRDRVRHSVHITNAWHSASGGVRTFYEAMLLGAERHRRRLTLVVPAERTHLERRGTFTRIVHVRAPRSPVFDRRYRLLLPHTYLSTNAALSRILQHTRPDIVEVADRYVLPWMNALVRWRAAGGDRPTLIGLSHERMDDNVRAWLGGGRVTLAASRAFLRHVYLPLCDAHIANSDYTADEMRALLPTDDSRRYPVSAVRVGPMGVDVQGLGPDHRSDALRSQWLEGAFPGTAVIVYAGRLSPEKHVLRLVEMLAVLRERGVAARLVVCGDGPLRTTFERAARDRVPGQVIVMGHQNRDTLARVLASADIFVHPNPHEPFGIGPLEAMASGTPVVLPRSGGVLMYADEGNSWLTAPSAQGLATGVIDVLRTPYLARTRREQALRDVHRWSWTSAVDGYFRLYDTIDDARRCGPADVSAARAFAWRLRRLF